MPDFATRIPVWCNCSACARCSRSARRWRTGLGLGLATLAVLTASNVAASLVGRALPAEIRIAVFVLLIAALVTAVELALAAWLPGLHAALGIFLPLIVTNCLLLARAEAFASRQTLPRAALDGFAMGGGFLLVLVSLGSAARIAWARQPGRRPADAVRPAGR